MVGVPFRLRFSLRQALLLMTAACLAAAAYREHVLRQRVARFADGVFASRGSLNVRYSWQDVQVAELSRYHDRPRMAAHLERIVLDETRSNHERHLALDSLGAMTDVPGVVDRLLRMLDSPKLEPLHADVIGTFEKTNVDAARIAARIAEFTDADEIGVRFEAYYVMGLLALSHPDVRRQILPHFIHGLDDSQAHIRRWTAGSLGSLGDRESAGDLGRLLDDPDDEVRIKAARSIWKLTSTSDHVLAIATEILCDDDRAASAKLQAAYALKEVNIVPPACSAVLEQYAANTTVRPYGDEATRLRVQLGAVAREILEGPGSVPIAPEEAGE